MPESPSPAAHPPAAPTDHAAELTALRRQVEQQAARLAEFERRAAQTDAIRAAATANLTAAAEAPAALVGTVDQLLGDICRLAPADGAALWRRDGDRLTRLGLHGGRPVDGGFSQLPIDRHGLPARAVLDGRVVHVPDLTDDADPECDADLAGYRREVMGAGVRSVLLVPLRRQGEAAGVLGLRRTTVRPFSAEEIALAEGWAAQALVAVELARLVSALEQSRLMQQLAVQTAVAVENVRLFTELEARTAELSRTVEELRALGEVSQAVNSSLDLQTVLATIVQHAVRLAGADMGAIFELDEAAGGFVRRATVDASGSAPVIELPRGVTPLTETANPMVRAVVAGQPLQIADLNHETYDHFATREFIRLGYLALLVVPLTRDGQTGGALVMRRRATGEFPTETIALLQTLGAQSVVAIHNAHLYAQIEQQRHQLEEVSRHKSAFLASMSHELRTPLNGIIGFSEVLLDPDMPVDEAMRTQFLENILTSGRHLLTLINDILDLAKVEAGKLELHPEEFELAEALQGVHAVVRAMSDRKQQRLELALPEGAGTAYHDPGRFKQVLFNLLSNAVKFTPEGGTVRTALELAPDGRLGLSVTDTGIGIAEADQARIFEEFSQIDSGYARRQQGTGLGLALVRDFVRLMGGTVAVRSAPGHGSTFTVRLPRRQWDPTTAATEAVGTGPPVLVVEDDPQASDLLALYLVRAGYRVERARTAGEALARVRAELPVAITLDLRLPSEADGWSLLRRLKADPATAPVPIVVISILDDRHASLQAGAAAHLVKPVEPELLVATVGRVAPAVREEASRGG